MDMKLVQRNTLDIPKDIADELEVFLYTNLSAIISPNSSVLLTPEFQAGLQVALNDVGIGHKEGLPQDMKDILDVFIITNLTIVVVNTTT